MKKYVTQCPHCQTRFRVVPDHIRISNGLVRCGHCREVFDARPSLTEWTPPAPPVVASVPTTDTRSVPLAIPKLPESLIQIPLHRPAAVEVLPSTVVPPDDPTLQTITMVVSSTEQHTPVSASSPLSTSVALAASPPLSEEPLPTPTETTSLDLATASPSVPSNEASPIGHVSDVKPNNNTSDIGEAMVTSSVDVAVASLPTTAESEQAIVPALAQRPAMMPVTDSSATVSVSEVSFVRQAQREAFWRQPWMQGVLLLLNLSLLLGLIGQITVQERHRIVAMMPHWRPWVEQLCQPINCDIQLLKQIQAVQIDSSALIDLKNGAYRFEVTLVNTATYPIALPAVELAITNANGQIIASKVVLPNDWSASSEALPPRAEHPLQTHLSFKKREDWPMSGYRALVFYP